jgi:broad specificity phosphatase PhoE
VIISLLRHASTAWNEEGRMQGRRDIPLSATGRAQAAAWRLPDSGVEWLSSPLARAVETARIVAGREPSVDGALVEMDWGEWEGATLGELRARYGVAYARNADRGLDFRPPGGESPRDVLVRVTRWLDVAAQRDRPIVAVTHNGVLRALLCATTGWNMLGKPPVELAPGTVHRFDVEPGPMVRCLEWNVPLAEGPASCPLTGATPPVPSAVPP